MAKVIIVPSLFRELEKKFKGEAHKIIDLIESVGDSPRKGKFLAKVGGISIKELKYKSFRFYFLTNEGIIKFVDGESLSNLLIMFVRMSRKKDQQKVISDIRKILIYFGKEGFN